MGEKPGYAILGSGYWAGRMRTILADAHPVACLRGARRRPQETSSQYRSRLSESFAASGAQVAWLCVPPGAHIPVMTQAALEAGLNVVVEKPWLNSEAETKPLLELASRKGLVCGVHYQYCLLEAVEAWQRDLNRGAGFEFGGRFTISRPDRVGMDPIENLGSHLISIRNYAVPLARLGEIKCGHEMADERRVWLARTGDQIASIDFLQNREPIIQRFIEGVESAMGGGAFPFGLDFALWVARGVGALKLNPDAACL